MPFDPNLPFEEVDETDTLSLDTVSKPKATGFDFNQPFEEVETTEDQSQFDVDYFKPKPLRSEKKKQEIGTFEGIANAAKNAFDSSRQAMDVVGGVTPEEAQNISKIEFDKKARKLAPGYDEYQKAEGWDAAFAFAKNPIEVTSNIIAEGLAGSLPALGAGLAAGGVGAAAGSVVPVLGTGAGFAAGQIAGTFAGSLATEYGGKVLEELQGEGMDISDPNSIQTFFSNEELVSKARDKALTRGVPVAAFDALSAGIGGKLGRVFGTKVLTEGGKVIGKQFATKTGEAATELGAQALAGGLGEVSGALAVGEPIEGKAVFGEVIGEVGPGSVEVLTGRIADKRAMAKAQEDAKIKAAAELSTTLEENSSPLTAKIVTAKTATSIEQDKLAAKLDEELSLTAVKPAAAPPAAVPTKDDYVARYSAIAQTAPEELIRAEQSFTNELATANTEEKRTNARNALDAIKEVKTVGVTPAAPTEPAAVAAQPPTTYATQEIIQPEGVRQEPQDGTQIGATEETGVGDSVLGAEGIQEKGQVDSTIFDLQSVANNTATREQISSLSLSGLVDIRKGQAIINEDGEGILTQAQAPLPTLTPEERAAEVEAAPVTPRPLPTDVLPTETPGAEYGREAELFDVFGGIRRRPVDVAEPIIREEPQTSPIVGGQVAEATPVEQVAETKIAEEPIISEKAQTSEIVSAETPAIVEQEQVAQIKQPAVSTPTSGQPFEFFSIRNTEKAPQLGSQFGQDIEPSGKYVSASTPSAAQNLDERFEKGVVRFENPLVVDFGGEYGTPTNWKNTLSSQYGGKTGAELSQAVRDAGYDGIVTVEPAKGPNRPASTSEIVDIRDFKPKAQPIEAAPAEAPATEVAPVKPLTEDEAETIRDVITLRKSQGREPNPEQVKRLAEYDAKKAGVEVQAGDIVSNIVVGHPMFESPQPELNNLVPIKVTTKKQLASPIQRAQQVRDTAQSYIGSYQVEQAKAKTPAQKKAFAKKFTPSELARQRDILDYIKNDVMPELDRLEKLAPSTTPAVSETITEPVAPTPQVEQEIEVGDEASVNLAGRNETVTIARIEDINGVPTAYFDYFGYKSRPLAEMQLVKKSKQNIARAERKAQDAKASQIEITPPKPEDFFSNEEITSLVSGKAPDGWKFNASARDDFFLTDTNGKRWSFTPQYENGEITSILMRAEGQVTGVTITKATASAVSEVPTTPTQPEGIAVGNRIKLGRSPQTYTIEEVIPQTAAEQELGEKYYSVKNERTGEVQVVEERDLKKVGGKKAIKMIDGAIANQEEATPIPEANRYTYEEAVKLVDSYFDKDGIPEGVVIVNNTTDKDLEMKAGYFVNRGQIVINLAYIDKNESLSDIISHELGHYIFSDSEFQSSFKSFWELMTPEEQAEADKLINQFYNKETGAVQMEEKQVRAFMQLIEDSKAMPKWKQILDSIKRWINEKLGTNFLVTDRNALAVLAVAHKRFKSGERIIREIDSGVLKMAAEPRREQVAGKERGEIITTPEGIIKQTNEVLRNKFFDELVVSDENTSAAWNYIEQLLDIESGAAYDLAGQINNVVDQETNSKTRMGAGLFSVSLANYAARLAAQGNATMISYLVRRINSMPTDNRGGTATESGRVLRGKREYDIDGYHTITTEQDSKVERTAATLFGTGKPSQQQIAAVDAAIKASEDTPIGEPGEVAGEIEKVEKRTGRNVIKKIEGKIKESTEPKKEELLISFENLDADKKIKGITLKYNPQKVNVAKNIKDFIIGKMVDYRKTLVNQGASGLESTFWQTMSDNENKPGPLGEIDKAQNNELAKIVQKTLIDLGLKGEPPNTKMTDIEKVASILNKQKLSDEKRLEADSRIVEEIERRRESDLASGYAPEAVNAKYDIILDAWNQSMSRQLNMPVSDNMLQRLISSELKEQNKKISELIDEPDGNVTAETKQNIVDSIIRKIYGVSKEFEAGIEIDENYDGLKGYLEQSIDNMYARQIEKKNAAYAKRQAKISLRNNVDGQAQSIIDQLADQLSDTPAFPEKQENQVKAIVQQDLRQRPDMKRKQPWTSQLTAKLMQAGVSEAQAETISNLVWRQHEIKAMDRELKELETAAEKGSLAVIIQRIKETPLEDQQKPEWMQDVIREYLVEAGLSSQAADTAARLYESVIAERFAEAKQKAFESTLAKSAPWNNYLSRNAQLGKNALKKIQDAIRTGVLDPTQTTEGIIAKENGWSGFSKEQLTRIVQLDGILSDDASDQVTKAEAMSELNKIIVKAKMPVRFKDAIGAYYVAQALMGIPTLLVNVVSPVGFSVRNMITDIGKYAFTEPSRIPMAFETFLDSMKSWYNQSSYAFRNQIYMNDVVEYLQGQNVLRELFDKGKDQWAKGDYANGMANMLVGMTQITGRVLSSLDQGAISMLENQNITRYAMEAMKQKNIPQNKRKEFANMILHMRRKTYMENVSNGMASDRAGVLADFAVRNEIIIGLREFGVKDKVLESAINDALQTVGRNKTIDIDRIGGTTKKLSDEGMLSYWPISFLEKIASGAAKEGPGMQIFSKMLYGFALVPARVFHTTAWYSPYGFVRLAVDKYKKNKGEDSPYAMSLQTELQYKQRLTETIAGSITMLGLAALVESSTDDDEEKKFKIVITGNGPSYSADKQYYDAWHKKYKPYSFHIVMGDTIIPINIGRGGEALFFPIMLAGALDDWKIKEKLNLAKKEPKELNLAVEVLGSAFFGLAQRGPYSAFSKPLFDATKDGKITEELVGQAGFFGKTFVPILGSSLSRNISDFINDPVDRSSLQGAIYANTPVVGPWIGTKALNALGQPMRADDWGDKLFKLGVPVVFSFPKSTPENELNELILKKGSGPSIPTRSNAQKRFGDVLTDKEFETYVREYGRVVSDKMFKNRKKLENMSVKNYDDELEGYVRGYSVGETKITGAADMAVRAVKRSRNE
jgi:hypothetical protein